MALMNIVAVWQPSTFPELLGAAAIWCSLGIGLLLVAFKLFDLMTPGIHFSEQLKSGNIAVGLVIASFLLCIAIIIHAAIG